MTKSPTIADEPDSGYPRLEQQINWYDSKSKAAQRNYKVVKLIEIAFGVMVPFTARIDGNVTAFCGAMALLLEGAQHISQWHHNWITYRSTCEALRHEKYSYLGRSSVYDGVSNTEAKKILVERVESLISTEHAKWISGQEYEIKKKKKGNSKR